MTKILIIDDEHCGRALTSFIKKHKRYVKLEQHLNGKDLSVEMILKGIDTLGKMQKRLAINTADSLTLVKVQDIIRFESNSNYTFIYTANGKKLLVSKTLKEFESQLEPYQFMRIHKSHLVNTTHIKKFLKSEGSVILTDDTTLPVSSRRKEEMINLLEKL
jgi:two-component system LytT family response regulator